MDVFDFIVLCPAPGDLVVWGDGPGKTPTLLYSGSSEDFTSEAATSEDCEDVDCADPIFGISSCAPFEGIPLCGTSLNMVASSCCGCDPDEWVAGFTSYGRELMAWVVVVGLRSCLTEWRRRATATFRSAWPRAAAAVTRAPCATLTPTSPVRQRSRAIPTYVPPQLCLARVVHGAAVCGLQWTALRLHWHRGALLRAPPGHVAVVHGTVRRSLHHGPLLRSQHASGGSHAPLGHVDVAGALAAHGQHQHPGVHRGQPGATGVQAGGVQGPRKTVLVLFRGLRDCGRVAGGDDRRDVGGPVRDGGAAQPAVVRAREGAGRQLRGHHRLRAAAQDLGGGRGPAAAVRAPQPQSGERAALAPRQGHPRRDLPHHLRRQRPAGHPGTGQGRPGRSAGARRCLRGGRPGLHHSPPHSGRPVAPQTAVGRAPPCRHPRERRPSACPRCFCGCTFVPLSKLTTRPSPCASSTAALPTVREVLRGTQLARCCAFGAPPRGNNSVTVMVACDRAPALHELSTLLPLLRLPRAVVGPSAAAAADLLGPGLRDLAAELAARGGEELVECDALCALVLLRLRPRTTDRSSSSSSIADSDPTFASARRSSDAMRRDTAWRVHPTCRIISSLSRSLARRASAVAPSSYSCQSAATSRALAHPSPPSMSRMRSIACASSRNLSSLHTLAHPPHPAPD
eukprot:scaffold1779_cov373-Prasinococcus_capsulatus_cf.AAC.3